MIIKEILIKDISCEHNIRQQTKDYPLTNLMQTIKDNGLLQPIGVKEVSENSYKILWGNRRLSACKKLGFKTIPAIIYLTKEEEMTEEEFIIVNGIENLQQSPNTLFEIGRVCKILRKTMSPSEIGVKLGISVQRVNNALIEINRVPVKWQRKIKIMENAKEEKQGFIPVSTAMAVVQMRGLSKDSRDKLFEYLSKNDVTKRDIEIIAALIQKGMSVKDAVAESNKYEYISLTVFCNKEKLTKLLQKYPSRIDLTIDALNKLEDGLAVKKF